MNHTQVKRTLFTITSEYFSGATVDMANTKRAKKTKPLVTMRFGTAHTTTFPVEKVLDGELCSCYPSTAKLEVQLFTDGALLPNGARENTAVGDLTDYVNYMTSKLMVTEFGRHDLTILTAGPVQEVSTIINDTSYEYRAMVEFDVNFTMATVGYGGILDESSVKVDEPDPEHPGQVLPPHIEPEWAETDSGGRTAEIAEKTVGYFTQVEIEETKE